MTIQPRYLTTHSQYLCNHTHLIDDIIPWVYMKSNPLHVGHHRHSFWPHILSWWSHTIVCMSWHTVCLWHHIHQTWCHTHCVYDNTSSIFDLKPILSSITCTVYVITPTLSKPSHQLCKISQVAYVCHHLQYTWLHIHPLRQQPLVFMTSHALYCWHHMHYIWHVIYCVGYHIHYICDITQCLYLWHQTLYVYDISTLYSITRSVMTTQQLCNFTATMSDITPTASVSSQPLDQFYQTKCMYDITATMCIRLYALPVTSHPQFRTSHHFMYDIRSTLSDRNSTVSLSSHPTNRWYHSHYMYDLALSISVTSHPLYLWHNIH